MKAERGNTKYCPLSIPPIIIVIIGMSCPINWLTCSSSLNYHPSRIEIFPSSYYVQSEVLLYPIPCPMYLCIMMMMSSIGIKLFFMMSLCWKLTFVLSCCMFYMKSWNAHDSLFLLFLLLFSSFKFLLFFYFFNEIITISM